MMPKFTYSPDVDILAVEFSEETSDHAEEQGPFILHFSAGGKLVSAEIMDAREFLLRSLEAVIPERKSDSVAVDR